MYSTKIRFFLFLWFCFPFVTYAMYHTCATHIAKNGFQLKCKQDTQQYHTGSYYWSGMWIIPYKTTRTYTHDFEDELIYITDGSVELIYGKQHILLKKGDWHWIKHDKQHHKSKWIIKKHLQAYYYFIKKHDKMKLPTFFQPIFHQKHHLYVAYFEMPKYVIKSQKAALLDLAKFGYPFFYDPKSHRIATDNLRLAKKFFISGFFTYYYK